MENFAEVPDRTPITSPSWAHSEIAAMTSSVQALTAVEEIEERVARYNAAFGLPCRVDSGGRIVMRMTDIGAVRMPVALGEATHERMRVLGIGCQILSEADAWTFLVRPYRIDADPVLGVSHLASESRPFNTPKTFGCHRKRTVRAGGLRVPVTHSGPLWRPSCMLPT
ncbi:hypothetical protein [Nocardia thraciensis]